MKQALKNWAPTLLFGALITLMLLGALLVGNVHDLDAPTVASLSEHVIRVWGPYYGQKYLYHVGLALLIALLAAQTARRPTSLKAPVTAWLLVVVSGLAVLILGINLTDDLTYKAFYDVLFPLARNAFPVAAGGLVFLLVQPWLLRAAKTKWALPVLVLALSVPALFHQDLFGLTTDFSLLGVVVLGFAGLVGAHLKDARRTAVWTVIAVVLAIGSIAAMGFLSRRVNGDLTTASRFIELYSPLVVLPAIAGVGLVQWVLGRAGAKPRGAVGLAAVAALALSATRNADWLLIREALAPVFGELTRADFVGQLRLAAATLAAFGCFVALLATLLHFSRGYQWLAVRLDRYTLGTLVVAIRERPVLLWHAVRHYWRLLVAVPVVLVLQFGATFALHRTIWMDQMMKPPYPSIFIYNMVKHLPVMLLSAALIGGALWLLVALTNRFWTPLALMVLVVGGFGIAGRMKMLARDEPILPADVSELKSASELSGMVGMGAIILIAVACLALIALAVWADVRAGSVRTGYAQRAVLVVLLGFGLFAMRNTGREDTAGYRVAKAFQNAPRFSNQLLLAQENGPILQFTNNLSLVIMAEPKGYSEQAIKQIYAKYQKAATAINRTRTNKLADQTIIFNLSEAFTDPARVPGVTLSSDPIKAVHSIEAAATGGRMVSNGYGGGTANMEYESLTGFALGNLDERLTSPYSQLVERQKVAPAISNAFKTSVGIHPYVATFYNRVGVYKKFGFTKFSYLGSKDKIRFKKHIGTNTYLSDQTLYDNAVYRINQTAGGQFMNLISIQNHYPYADPMYPKYNYTASGTTVKDPDAKTMLEHYAQGIAYTDQAVAAFKAELDKIQKPITWVFYGDHLPAEMFNAALSGPTSLLLHQTDFFIYTNKYAREHGALTAMKDVNVTGPSNFIALALKQSNSKVNAMTALLTRVAEQLPFAWIKDEDSVDDSTVGMRFILNNGHLIHYADLTAKQKSLLHDYQLLQYDITTGKQYSQKLGMTFK
ncbi:LTA synthase family protein [Lacticaseibacillus kribbianus]|uniref:LTA synthase family protein n=1 Tax=Lacticaseibacillus kribbianus TaxID=2926292 RepID=UPI001CD26126|nr:alkaline phosphatase family protein [Lacticaseibacillus kribbianus]